MDEQFEKLLKKELEEKQAERERQAKEEKTKKEAEKFAIKLTAIIFGIALIIGIIFGVVMCSKPKDYEYKITQFEVMEFDETKGIVSIEIKNNTNKTSYTYVMIEVRDGNNTLIAYSEAAFTPPPKSTDIYQITVQSKFGDTLYGSRAKIGSFNVFDFNP